MSTPEEEAEKEAQRQKAIKLAKELEKKYNELRAKRQGGKGERGR